MNEETQAQILHLIPPFIQNHQEFTGYWNDWLTFFSDDDIESGIMTLHGWRDRKLDDGIRVKYSPKTYNHFISGAFQKRTGTETIDFKTILRRM